MSALNENAKATSGQLDVSVSAVMCTFNGEKYLREQLKSIAAQTTLPAELVICDDGSSDRTASIIRRFVEEAPFPVRYIQNESTLGVTKNFEKAMREAKENLIVLADQDDLWEVDKVRKVCELAASAPASMLLFSNANCIDDTGNALSYKLWDKAGRRRVERLLRERDRQFSILLGGDIVTGATVAIRRSLLDRALPIPTIWLHDAWLAILAGIGGQIAGTDDCLTRYRIHGAQAVGVAGSNSIGLARSSRTIRKKKDLQKFLDLKEKISACLSESQNLELDAKICHLRIRSSLSPHPAKRIGQVLGEGLSGRYSKYSSGLRSIALDLMGN